METKKQKRKGGERERKERTEGKGKRRKRENVGGEEEKWEAQQARLYFYNYCGLARIKGN